MRATVLASALCATWFWAVPTPAAAQGFGVYEHGTCAMGRAGTGVAAPCPDGSAMFLNPAGLVGRRGWDVTLGLTVIDAFGGFINDTTQQKTALANSAIPVPHAYLRYGVSDRVAAGIGVFVPYGLGTRWPETFEGRFSGYDNDLRSIYIQPTLAVEPVAGLRIGAGLDIVVSSVILTQRIDLYSQEQDAGPLGSIIVGQLGIPQGTEIADARLESDHATGIGGHFGATYQATDRVSIGARYLTQVSLDYTGTVDFTQIETGIIIPDATALGVPGPLPVDQLVASLMADGGPLEDQSVETAIPMPSQFVAGIAVDVSSKLRLLGDYQFTRWSVFDTLTIEFENGGEESLAEDYNNTSGLRFGAEWMPRGSSVVRLGYLWHEAAAPDQTVTPLLPEGQRNEVTVGYGFRLSDMIGVDAAYQYIRQENRRGRMRSPLPGESFTPDLNVGVYEFRAHLLGLTVHLAF